MVVSSYRYPVRFSKMLDLIFPMIIILGMFLILSSSVAYANDLKLTDIFDTKSFRGDWEIVNKYNWLGAIFQFFIVTVCIFGVFSVAGTLMVTFLYLSGKAHWDTVDEYKQDDAGSRFFGFESTVKKVFNANRGSGLDAVVGFAYSLMPNIKRYSEYHPERMAPGLSEDDTILTYVMKKALPVILMIFFFSMGFNGSLMKGFAVVVDGMGAVADRIVNTNVEGWVRKKLATGESYNFTIGNAGTPTAKFGEKLAMDIYGKVLSRTDVTDTAARLAIGLKVEQTVFSEFLGSETKPEQQRKSLEKKLVQGATKESTTLSNDADVGALSYDVVINTNEKGITSKSYSIASFLPKDTVNAPGAEQLYIHVIIRKGKVTEADFFVRPGADPKIDD